MRHMVLLLNPAFRSSSPTPWHIQPSNLGTTPPHVGHLQYLYLKMYISWPIVSGVNEATFRDDSLKWITRISSCLGAWDTFLFFSSSLSFFSYSGHTWLVNCMMCDDVWVFAPNSHWPVLSRREGGAVTDTPHAHFPPLCFFVRVNEREREHLIQRKHSGNLRRWLTTVKFNPLRENPLQNRAVKDRENKQDQPLKAEGLGFSYVRFYCVISCPVSL